MDGYDQVGDKAKAFADEANQILNSVQDIVYIKPIDETEVMDSVTKGKEQVEAINQAFIAVDEEGASRLEETQDDLKTMQTFLSDMSTKFVDSASISSYSVASTREMTSIKTIRASVYSEDRTVSAMYGDKLEGMTLKEIEKGKKETLNQLGKAGQTKLNQAYIELEKGKIDRTEYANILQSELATSIEQGQMSDEARANLWEYIDETKGEIGVGFSQDVVKDGGEQAGLAFLRKRLNDTIDKGAVQGPKGDASFRMMDKETVKKVDEAKSTNAKLTKYGKWAGKGLTGVGAVTGFIGDINDGKTKGEALAHTGATTGVGFASGAFGTALAAGLLGSNPVGWAAVGTAAIGVGVGTLGSIGFDYAYDTNFLGTKYVVDKVGHGLSWTGNKIKDGASWTKDKAGEAVQVTKDKAGEAIQVTKDKAGEAIQATKDKAKQGTRNIIKGVGEAFKGGPSSIKPKMDWGWN